MSLASNLVVSDGGSDVTFDEITRDANAVVRSDTSRPLSAPRTLTIKHTMAGANAKGPKVDRHLVSASDTVVVSGAPLTAVANVSLVVPRDYTGNLASLVVVAHLALTEHLTQILRGES